MKHAPRTTNKCIRHKFNCALMLLCYCALVLLSPSASAQAEALTRTAKLLPPETVLLMNINNFSQLKKQFEETNFYKLYKDPAMAAFVEDAKEKLLKKIREMDNEIARAIADGDVLPEGRAAFALVLNKQAAEAREPMALFITQWGEAIGKIKEAVGKQVKKALEEGARQRSEDYRGVTIVTLIKERPPIEVPDWSGYKPQGNPMPSFGTESFPRKEVEEVDLGGKSGFPDMPMKVVEQPPKKTHYCFVYDCLIGSEDMEILKFVIAHIKGASSPTLADDTDYNATMKTIGPHHDIDFYINIKQIIKTVLAKDSAGKANEWTANLGLDNIAALGCSVAVATSPGSSGSGKAFLKINGAKKGICKMLETESAVLRAPRFIPASAYSAAFFNLNIKKVYDELYSILYSFNPQYAAMMHMLDLPDSPEGEPGVKLKSDVISHLGSQIVLSQSINKPFSNSSMPTESLVALAVNNRNALEKSLSLLHSKMIAPNNPDARRELLGHTIYLLSPLAMPFFTPGMTPMLARRTSGGQALSESDAPQIPTLAFTITDTHLIFASEPAIERVIRALSGTDALSLGSAKWFTFAKSAIPSVVGLAALQDNVASSEFFWWTMKEAGKARDTSTSLNPNPLLMFSQMGFDLFNFGLLPEFDAVRKYFGLSAFYGISRPDGFFFEFKYLNPPATD